jgi:tetrahydrodipicolinate N-succinyltransferase
MPKCLKVINANSRIGKGTYVCAGAVVNHNAVIGEYCPIDCNALFASRAVVTEKTKVTSCTVWDKC